jgi:polysaccharide biosynthesis/export protein
MRGLTYLRHTFLLASLLLLVTMASAQLKQHERYVLRHGDVIDLQYRYTPDLDQTVTVQPDGFVSIKIGGEVRVGGLTVEQARLAIVKAVSNDLNDPEVNLILKDFAHDKVLVSGEVGRPGPIDLRENLTVVSAIISAGGYTADAKSGEVLLFRRVNGDVVEVHKLSLTRLEKPQTREQDMALHDGDMILVTRDKVSRLEHYIKIVNLGMYFNPLPTP